MKLEVGVYSFDTDSGEDLEELEYCQDFNIVQARQEIDKRRWYSIYKAVYEHQPSKRYFEVRWKEPATEMQTDGIDEDWEFTEVTPYQETVTMYRPKID